MKIIPTKYKIKIPKGFSYPIGAESLSSALCETPQFEQFTSRFCYQDEIWASSYTLRIREKSPIKVIEVSYTNYKPGYTSSNQMIESGYYEPKWEIRVNSVPSEYAATVKEQLVSNVLPELSVLLKKAGKGTLQNSLLWVVEFNPKNNRVSLLV